jgi:hypothetical protein
MGRNRSKEVWEVDCMDCGRSRDLKKEVSRCPFMSCMSTNIEVRERPKWNTDQLFMSKDYGDIDTRPEFSCEIDVG